VWGEDVVERLVTLSGGHLRQLFLLIRSALDRGDAPVTMPALDAAVRRQALDSTLPLTGEHWAILTGIHSAKRKPDTDQDLFFGMLRDLDFEQIETAGA
jgi:hypothetical protein